MLAEPEPTHHTVARLRHQVAVARLRALLPLWADHVREGYSVPAVDYGRTKVAGSAPHSRPPLPAWLLELSEAMARLSPHWQQAIHRRYVVGLIGIEAATVDQACDTHSWSDRAYDELLAALGWLADTERG